MPSLDSHVSHVLRNTANDELLAFATAQLAAAGADDSPELVDALRAGLARCVDVTGRKDVAQWLANLPSTSNATRLRALLATDLNLGSAEERQSAWRSCLNQRVNPDPADVLAYARILSETGKFDEAERQMRRLLECPLPYSFFVRAEKLIGNLAREESGKPLRVTRIALLGEHTTGFLAPLLRALCLRDRIQAEFYQGAYGSQTQEVLDGAGALQEFRPAIVILPDSWRTLRCPTLVDDPDAFVTWVLAERRRLWDRVAERFSCHVIQFAFDYPLVEPNGPLSETLIGGRANVIGQINRALFDRAPGFVSILDIPQLQRRAGSHWEHAKQWASYQQHPATAALPELAEGIAAHVRAVLGLTKKVLVTDLDNTLWGGVIGEDGIEGIHIGPGTPAGEAHLALQHYLKDLKARGVLLAVSSKNNPDDARAPFEKHPGMALALHDFASFQANWDDKAQNIRAIARELSLGLDSFVFVDDSPVERAWVQSQIPEVAVAPLGESVFTWTEDLDRRRFFDAITLSVEDLQRAAQYRQEAARQSLSSTYESLDDFLAQLNLQPSAEPVDSRNLARVTQLVNKTNQFNLTVRRYAEAQVQEFAVDPEGWAQAFHLSDRFGSYGLIGVILCRPAESGTAWEIDTWLMSCRALGRKVENFMFERLVEAAAARGIGKLIGIYVPGAKNALVARHYEQMGFNAAGEFEVPQA
jgi:FkbH-like protein